MTPDQLALKQAAETSAQQAGFTKDAVHVMPDGSDGWRSHPGKFEGEQWYAPYFYDVWMCGEGDELESGKIVIPVSDDERAVFGLTCANVFVHESADGFFFCELGRTPSQG